MKSIHTLGYYLINTLCSKLYKGAYRQFISVKDIRKVQEEKLIGLLKQNEDTQYGKKYGFSTIKNIKEYQDIVSISSYETYRPHIEQLMEKEENLLTKEKILVFEPTSGSVKAAKLIPYTKTLKEEFQKGIKPWIYNLYTTYPEIKWGKSYWSISPVTDRKYTNSGIPIGFEEDTAYFGKIEQYLMDKVFVSLKDITKETDMDRFYRRTVLELLKTKTLTLISVWNPTFLLLLLDYIMEHKEELLNELNFKRKKEIEKAMDERNYEKIWPNLKVISCWCDAYASNYAKTLKELFPNTFIQPKGLLSTESFVSFPIVGQEGAVLSIYSHFYEFMDTKTKEIKLADELETDKEYEVIVTTGGGFYRYRTYDVIEAIGRWNKLPLFVFKGKSDKISDRFGEKIHEDFIREVVTRLVPKTEFYMMAPHNDGYILYIKGDHLPTPCQVDELLRENFHYDYCRKLGQLKGVRLFILTGDPKKEYIEACLSFGQKLGDIKQAYLSLRDGWEQFFKGYIKE